MILAKYRTYLESRGLSLSWAARTTVEEVMFMPWRFTGSELAERLDRGTRRVPRPNVFRTVARLVDAGILRAVETGGELAYEAVTDPQISLGIRKIAELPMENDVTTPATDADSQPAYFRSNELLSREDTRLLVVDVQEKLMPLIPGGDRVIANCRRLIAGSRLLGVPVFATEQYPKGLGATVAPVAEMLGGVTILEKLRFSSAECLGWPMAGDDSEQRNKVVVVGIEAHVCVLQTVLDLLSMGYVVHVPTDAVDSRGDNDRETAFSRMADSGALLTTTEAVLFELCEVAGTPEFKEISRLVKDGTA